MKFEFSEFQWAERPDWIKHAKDTTISIWQEEFKASSRVTSALLSISQDAINTGNLYCANENVLDLEPNAMINLSDFMN